MAEMHHSAERGYIVTLTVTEYDALKVRIAELEAWSDATYLAECQARIATLEAKLADTGEMYREEFKARRRLEASLRELLEDLSEDRGQRHHRDKYRVYQVGPQTIAAAQALLTPVVSTLCAICDQIKELHPSTHPWTAKASAPETPAERHDLMCPGTCDRCGNPINRPCSICPNHPAETACDHEWEPLGVPEGAIRCKKCDKHDSSL